MFVRARTRYSRLNKSYIWVAFFIFISFPNPAFYYWPIQQRLVIRKSNGNDCITGVPFTNVNIDGVSGNVSK